MAPADKAFALLVEWLAALLGAVCSATGKSPEQLEQVVRDYPFAFLLALVLALVAVFDVLIPLLWLPFKLLNNEAERRASDARAAYTPSTRGAEKRQE
ncbi:hypothetical protein KFE25_005873 [Diacronema lutheri]|uniref:Uncharacterized protein n=1 Tax=Diacronema lutheri TaxID=2081491 RepID=A0A8J6CJ08_DIALT|nr:hypothetical protein KFE25_005873 [Diacronema lutheri]